MTLVWSLVPQIFSPKMASEVPSSATLACDISSNVGTSNTVYSATHLEPPTNHLRVGRRGGHLEVPPKSSMRLHRRLSRNVLKCCLYFLCQSIHHPMRHLGPINNPYHMYLIHTHLHTTYTGTYSNAHMHPIQTHTYRDAHGLIHITEYSHKN